MDARINPIISCQGGEKRRAWISSHLTHRSGHDCHKEKAKSETHPTPREEGEGGGSYSHMFVASFTSRAATTELDSQDFGSIWRMERGKRATAEVGVTAAAAAAVAAAFDYPLFSSQLPPCLFPSSSSSLRSSSSGVTCAGDQGQQGCLQIRVRM